MRCCVCISLVQILTAVAAMDDVQKVQGLESETGPHGPDELVMITPARTFTTVNRRCEEEGGPHEPGELVTNVTPVKMYNKARYEVETGPHKPDELVTNSTPVKTCTKVKYGEETGPHKPDKMVM